MINYHSTAAQDRLMREHFVFKFSYNFFGSKVAQYSPCTAIRTTTVRGNSKRLILWLLSYDGVWIFVLCHTQTTKNSRRAKNVMPPQSCPVHVQDWRVIGRTSNALLLYDVIDFAMLRETTRRTQVFLLHAMAFMHWNFLMPAQCAKGCFRK